MIGTYGSDMIIRTGRLRMAQGFRDDGTSGFFGSLFLGNADLLHKSHAVAQNPKSPGNNTCKYR